MMKKEMSKKKISFKDFFLIKKNVVFFVIAVLAFVLFAYFGFTMVNLRSDINLLERQKTEIAARCEEQEQTNKELQAVLDNEDKGDYIEQKAREKGYGKSNEIHFYDISASE